MITSKGITLKATDIRQQLNLIDRSTRTYLVLEMPNGVGFVAEITQAAAEAIMEATGGAVSGPAPSEPVQEEPAWVQPEETGPAFQETVRIDPSTQPILIEWEKLPVLPLNMKRALRALNAPPFMTGAALQTMVQDIQTNFTEEDWQRVRELDTPTQPSMPAPPPIQMPTTIGVIDWQNGSAPVAQAGIQGRAVQADAKGNPILPGYDSPSAAYDEEEGGAAQF